MSQQPIPGPVACQDTSAPSASAAGDATPEDAPLRRGHRLHRELYGFGQRALRCEDRERAELCMSAGRRFRVAVGSLFTSALSVAVLVYLWVRYAPDVRSGMPWYDLPWTCLVGGPLFGAMALLGLPASLWVLLDLGRVRFDCTLGRMTVGCLPGLRREWPLADIAAVQLAPAFHTDSEGEPFVIYQVNLVFRTRPTFNLTEDTNRSAAQVAATELAAFLQVALRDEVPNLTKDPNPAPDEGTPRHTNRSSK